MKLSNKDKLILNELIKNGRVSLDKLSKKTGVPVSTVHRRVKRLELKGLIRGYEPIIDYSMIDYNVTLFLIIDLEEGIDTNVTLSKLKSYNKITELHLLQGSDFDLIAKAKCKNLVDADKLIKEVMKLEGVEEVNSMVSAISEKESLVMPI